MKRRLISRAAAFTGAALAAGLLVTLPPSRGDAELNAETVAARVDAFYNQTTTLQASFYQTYYLRVYDRYQRSRGRIQIEKPGRLRFDYAAPNGKIIVSDGSMMTVYEPGDDGAAGQYLRRDVGEDALPTAFEFLMGEGRLADNNELRLYDGRRWGFPTGHILELRPRQPDPRYSRVLLYVDAHPDRLGVVRRIRIDDHEGNRNKLELSSMRFNRDVPDSTFRWSPPSGARLISF